MSSPILITVPYGQIYHDLELGAIDAETQPFFAIQEMKSYEVQDYIIKANQLPFIGTVAANHKFVEGLPQDIRAVIDDAIEGANEYIFDFKPKLNKKRLQMILQAKPSMKYIELTDEEIGAFKEKAKPLRQKYLKMGGEGAGEVLDAVLDDIRWAEKNR